MNKFTGRKDELSFLQEKYNSKNAELLIIYGRRRVGKTETLVHFTADKQPLFFTCTQTEDHNQLKNFSYELLSFNIPQAKYISEFSNWERAFLAVTDISRTDDKKQILVIDEFPYMAKENPEIPSILQKLWDTQLKNSNLMIILCGSSMSYIEKEILSEKNPLYGRATGIYKMLPMPYSDAKEFFPTWTQQNKIIAYSILGGIPYYLNQFDQNKSLKENICNNILKKGAILYSEPDFLMRQELREPTTYNTIIQSIASGKTSFNEIQQSTLIEKGKLSVYLKNLVKLGIVNREFPVLSSKGEKQNTQRGLYTIQDFFFRFWYRFVFQNFSALEFGNYENIYDNLIKKELNSFSSSAFENICIEWLWKQNKNHKLDFTITKAGKWWNKKEEIDIVAFNETREKLILAECKFHNTPVNDSDLKKHICKALTDLKLKSNVELNWWYISFNGYTQEALSFAKINNIRLLTGEDLKQ